MKSRFLIEAQWEMEEAAEFYDAQQGGLGDRFLNAIERAVADVEQNPRRWPKIRNHVRRRLVATFPYAVLYRVRPHEVVIIAIMHLHRHPGYWVRRLGKL